MQNETSALREEVEALAAFLHLLQQEYTQLQGDFVAVLRACGGSVTATAADFTAPPASAVTRIYEGADGTTTFSLARRDAGSAEDPA